MKNIKCIKGIKDIIEKYEVFILDQWGVLHDGKRGYKHSIKCVDNLFQKCTEYRQLIVAYVLRSQ